MANKVRTRHHWFSISGVIARIFIATGKVAPEPLDVLCAACFGIVEVLGAKRFWKLLGPMIKAQLREQFKIKQEKK